MKKSLNSKKVVQIGILATSAAALITGVTVASTLDNSSEKQMNSQKLAGLNNKKVSNDIKTENLKTEFNGDVKATAYSIIDANAKLNNVTLTAKQIKEVKKYTEKFLDYRKGHGNLSSLEAIKGFLKQNKGVDQSKYDEIFNILNVQIRKQNIQMRNEISQTNDKTLVNPYGDKLFSKEQVRDFISVTKDAFDEGALLAAGCTAAAAGFFASAPFTFGISAAWGTAATVAAGYIGAHTDLLHHALNGAKDEYSDQKSNGHWYMNIGTGTFNYMKHLFASTDKVKSIIKSTEWAVPFAPKGYPYFDAVVNSSLMRRLKKM
ncbi:MAG: hypothetical protein HRT98_02200 [Mycoplasmatales bacterium]|nr:hypothetical protein [Mycoplasmatales bacterium]